MQGTHRREGRHGHTGHEQDAELRQLNQIRDRQNADPTPQEVAEALDEIASFNIPGTPSLSALKTLENAGIDSVNVAGRSLKSYSIARGNPGHGAMRSDDHISSLKIETSKICPEDDCMGTRAIYVCRAHHNIAGREALVCDCCDHEYHTEEWG